MKNKKRVLKNPCPQPGSKDAGWVEYVDEENEGKDPNSNKSTKS